MDWEEMFKLEPMPHQVEALEYALEHHYSINGFSMGTGKSFIAIMLSKVTKLPTLVVCPAFLKRNWETEFRKFCKQDLNIRVLFSRDLKHFKVSNEDIIIVNYEILKNCRQLFYWAGLVIADESHYLANPSAQRTMSFADFMETERPERLLMMSGSPIRGKVPQWFAPIYICSLNPKGTSGVDIRQTKANSFWNFQREYCIETVMRLGNRRISKFEGLKNVEGLKKLLKNKYVRKVPSFKLELPTLFDKEVSVDYADMDKDLQEAWEEYSSGSKISEHVSSAKLSSALNKVPFTFNYVKNIIEEGDGPVVIYTDHISPAKKLKDMFVSKGYSAEFISGEVDTEKRNEYVQRFQSGDIDILANTIGAASTGLTLTAARNLVFNDISWINTENDQAKKRIHRIGQERDCVIHYILGSEIDKMITRTVTKKDDIMKQTVEI